MTKNTILDKTEKQATCIHKALLPLKFLFRCPDQHKGHIYKARYKKDFACIKVGINLWNAFLPVLYDKKSIIIFCLTFTYHTLSV